MSFNSGSRALGISLRRGSIQPRVLLQAQTRLAHQDYGSGKGDPVGENPEKQGPNPSADKEHPGPPPPKAGHGSGSSPTKGTSGGHNTPSSGSSQKRQFSTLRALHAEKKPKSTEGLEPKILNESSPKEDANEDVRKHNEEFAQRADRAHEGYGDKDKVSSKFWSEGDDARFFKPSMD